MNRYFLIASLSLFTSGVALADEAHTAKAALTQPDKLSTLAELKGKILSVDSTTRQFTVADPSQSVALTAKADARVLDEDNKELAFASLKKGTPVLVYYNTKDKTATEIDLQPSVAEAVLGAPVANHP